MTLLLIAIVAGSASVATPAGTQRFTLSHGGLSRAYLVHVPPAATGALPVVIDLRGGGSNGAAQETHS